MKASNGSTWITKIFARDNSVLAKRSSLEHMKLFSRYFAGRIRTSLATQVCSKLNCASTYAPVEAKKFFLKNITELVS